MLHLWLIRPPGDLAAVVAAQDEKEVRNMVTRAGERTIPNTVYVERLGYAVEGAKPGIIYRVDEAEFARVTGMRMG